MQFANAWMLYALWLVPVLGLAGLMLHRRRNRALEGFLSPAMRQKLCPPPRPHRFYWQGAGFLAGTLLALVAAARPQWGAREEVVVERGRDLVVALDVSRSMLARDVHPSRLQRAKADIQDLLRALRGDRAALVAFRGRAVPLCPLTTDYAYLEQVLDDVTVDSAPRGETDIGDAIRKSLAAFESDRGSHRAVILISDGEDLSGKAREAAAEAKAQGVVIFTVGLGDPQGAKIPSPAATNEVMMYQGQAVVTRLEHETLKAIAEATGGAYVPVGVSNVKLGDLYRDHLSKIAAQDIEESLQRRQVDRFPWFLAPGLGLLMLAAFLSRGRLAKPSPPPRTPPPKTRTALHGNGKQRPPDLRKAVLSCALVFFLAGSMVAAEDAGTPPPQSNAPVSRVPAAGEGRQPGPAALPSNAPAGARVAAAAEKPALAIPPGREGARLAQRLYLRGHYKEAAEAYLQAAGGASSQLRGTLAFNAACALYRAGQYQASADKFAEAARQADRHTAAGHYNAGCAWFRLAEQSVSGSESNRNYAARPPLLERAGLAFQRALRLDEAPSSARDNLAAVVQALPEARNEAKTRALLEKYGQTPPDQLADELLSGQRQLIADMPAAMTNPAPARIEMMEALAERQLRNTDLLIPLRASLAAALSQGAAPALPGAGGSNAPANPQQQAAEINRHLEAVQAAMQESRDALRNLEHNAYGSAADAEAGVYQFWKAVAPFPKLLREDMRRQTNAIDQASSAPTNAGNTAAIRRDVLAQQEEAIRLTQLFTERFTQAVPPEGLKPPPAATTNALPPAPSHAAAPETAAGATNAPAEEEGITPEKRAKILALAGEAKAAQEQASKLLTDSQLKDSLPEQHKAYALLAEIEKLLPKNKQKQDQDQQQQQQQQQDQQKQDQDQQKQDQQQQPPQDQGKQDQPAPEQSQPPPDQPPPEQPPPQEQPQPKPEDQPQPKDKDMTPEQARLLLEKARQREKEHQEERQRDQYIPPSPVEKDW